MLSGGFCFRLMPFPMFLGEVMSVFRLFWWPLASCIILDCFDGLWPFGNKFLLIQNKKSIMVRLGLTKP